MEQENVSRLEKRSQELERGTHQNHRMKKRNAPKIPKRENDIYVTNKTNLQCQIKKCLKLFEEGYSEIVVHGLGAAIGTAVNLSLILQDKLSYTVDVAVNTSTVELLDDFFPTTDEEVPFSKKRSNSAVHIKIYRKANF